MKTKHIKYCQDRKTILLLFTTNINKYFCLPFKFSLCKGTI